MCFNPPKRAPRHARHVAITSLGHQGSIPCTRTYQGAHTTKRFLLAHDYLTNTNMFGGRVLNISQRLIHKTNQTRSECRLTTLETSQGEVVHLKQSGIQTRCPGMLSRKTCPPWKTCRPPCVTPIKTCIQVSPPAWKPSQNLQPCSWGGPVKRMSPYEACQVTLTDSNKAGACKLN